LTIFDDFFKIFASIPNLCYLPLSINPLQNTLSSDYFSYNYNYCY